ncbi:hypothetical protein NC652_007980 [Populus alba x Populus x berolinensis]|nr:hypothetical protein NC652_007980 [Populus alba x Populus x berolinensis]
MYVALIDLIDRRFGSAHLESMFKKLKSQQISGNFPNPSSSHKAEPNLKYEAAEVNKERLLRSAVAYARSPEIMQKLHGYFTMDGVSRCFPRPMGGNGSEAYFRSSDDTISSQQ